MGWWLGVGSGAMILLYHRIAELEPDPWDQAVRPARFAEHLEALRRHAVVLSVFELVRALDERRLPRRCVALSFDDGYADNLYNAKPLLERYGVAATVFVVAGGPGPEREFWWDELEQLLWQWPAGRGPLRLEIRGEACVVEPDSDPMRRYHAVWQRLHPLTAEERGEIMERLQAWSGVAPRARATHRALTADELVELAAGGLIEIGAHTMTHPSLPTLTRARQYEEIAGSRAACAAILGRPPAGFAYPHGDSTQETASLAREAGFRYAGVVLGDVVHRGSDRFMLPRMPIRDWDGDAFARRLLSGFLRT